MTEPVTACCLVALFRRMGLCKSCMGGEEEEEEGGGGSGTLSISTSNSCRNWMCCTGTECCVSQTTTIVGSSRVAVATTKASKVPLTTKTIDRLFLDEGDGLTVDAERAQNKATNKHVLEQLVLAYSSKKVEVSVPEVAIIAAIRTLPDQKFANWDGDSEVALTTADIKAMKAVVKAEQTKVANLRTALMQKQLATKRTSRQSSPARSDSPGSGDVPKQRVRRGRKTVKIVIGEGKKDKLTFNVVLLANDILSLAEVTRAEALDHAKAIESHFKDQRTAEPSKQEIWNYLEEYVFLNNLTLKGSACGNYTDQATLLGVAAKTQRVADLTLQEYCTLRDPRQVSPVPSPVASGVSPSPTFGRRDHEDDITPVLSAEDRRRLEEQTQHKRKKKQASTLV